MLGVGETLPDFKVTGVKPKFNRHEENGESAFDALNGDSFPGKWKVIFFYPKDFTFVCPTEIAEFARLGKEFADRDAIVLGGSTDNEFVKLAWRRDHKDLKGLRHALLFFNPAMAQSLGVLHPDAGVALRATIIVDPQGIVRFASANDLSVGRNVDEVLRVLDGLQTDELCPCNWKKGEETLTQQLKK